MALDIARCDSSVFRINWITHCRDPLDLLHADVRLQHLLPDASALVLSCATHVTLKTRRDREPQHVCDVKLRLHKGKLDQSSCSNAIRETGDLLELEPAAAWAIVNDCKAQYLMHCFTSKTWETDSFHVRIRRRTRQHAPSGSEANFQLEIRLWLQYFTAESNLGVDQLPRTMPSEAVQTKSAGETNAQKHFAELLIKQANCDVTFQLRDGSTFGGHSAILMARSPAFAAMLRHRQPGNHVISVDDIELAVLQQTLHYIYTGRRSMSLNEESAKQLIVAADKYHVDDLMDECSAFLERSVIADNAIELLDWANRHGLARLKAVALDLIVQQCQELRGAHHSASSVPQEL